MPFENSVQKCSCVLAVRHLFTVGRGTDRKKINLRQEPAVKKGGGARTDREKESRETVQSGPGWVPGFPPSSSVYTQRNFVQFHSSPFSGHWKGTDSFLVTHPLSTESGCYHGKIQTFGILSGLRLFVVLQPQCKQQPRVMPVKSVCAWGSGRIAGIKSNRTPHSGGPICSAGSVCIHVVLSGRSSRSVSLCLLCAGECIQHCSSYGGWPCQMLWPQRPLLLNQTRAPRGQGGTLPSMPSGSREVARGRYWYF